MIYAPGLPPPPPLSFQLSTLGVRLLFHMHGKGGYYMGGIEGFIVS